MRRKDLLILAALAAISAILTLAVAGNLFDTSKNRSTEVPVVRPIVRTLPDIKNDSAYNKIFNNRALDPTQPVQVGNGNPRVFQ